MPERDIRGEFEPRFEAIVRERPPVQLPSPEAVESEVISIAEAIETADVLASEA